MNPWQRPPAGARVIPLGRDIVCWVNDDDYDFLYQWKWRANNTRRYAIHQPYMGKDADGKSISGPMIYMHHFIVSPPPGYHVDHGKHVAGIIDNRKENLRICTRAQNMANQKPRFDKITSPFKGVYYSKDGTRHWVASIGSGANRQYLGRFSIEAYAAYAYDLAAIERSGDFARTNFVGDHAEFSA